MDQFIADLVEIAPAVAILLFLVVRQDRRNEKLVDALTDCYRDCEDRIESEGGKRR